MPIYEYVCAKCGRDFEIMQKFSDKALQKCPKCKGRVKKKISSSAFILKGSGWYITDYARKGKKEAEEKPQKTEKTEKKETKKEQKTGGAKATS
ncbi:MAG: zinc ribbon domain-containing protein [Deltaproteobacteria bacterium]|nr:zinc ribbon domain-containing protein [Deltaproteobacteria bacterium]